LPLQNRRASANTADVPESFKGFLQEGKEFRSILEEKFPPELLVLLLLARWGHDSQSWQCWQCWQFWPAYAGRANYNATSSGEVSP